MHIFHTSRNIFNSTPQYKLRTVSKIHTHIHTCKFVFLDVLKIIIPQSSIHTSFPITNTF